MTLKEAVDHYDLLTSIVSDICVVKDVDWEQDEHVEAVKFLRQHIEEVKLLHERTVHFLQFL